MSDNSSSDESSPFPPGYRASGVLLHVTSLPSPYGIGDLGPAASTWIDVLQRLAKAGGSHCPWTDWLRQLSLSIPVVFRRERTPDQSGLA